jgi:two-component system response regulator PhoP
MRLLVVEDERVLREQLIQELSRSGYAVDGASEGRKGLSLGLTNPYDLAVIDLGLPQLGGFDLIRELRTGGCEMPILILTARGDWQDKVQGLEAGADDYLVKPFHMEELKARLNALLRRSGGHANPIFHYGPLVVDTGAKTVHMDGGEVELTSYEYNTLEYLIHRAGKVISRTEFTEHLYHQDFDRDSNVIEVFIGRLRKKLDPDGKLKPIQTVRGQGYRFALEKSAP